MDEKKIRELREGPSVVPQAANGAQNGNAVDNDVPMDDEFGIDDDEEELAAMMDLS